MDKEPWVFCRIIDLLHKEAQILYVIGQREEDDKYELKITCYFPDLGEISLIVGGWDKREDAFEDMMNQTIESAENWYEKFSQIADGNIEGFLQS